MESMDTKTRREATLLMKAYNEAFAEAFDAFLEGIPDEATQRRPDFDEIVRNSVHNTVYGWFSRPLPVLEGRTPEHVIDGLDTLERALVFFEVAASVCEDEIPDALKIKLGSFGTDAIDALMNLALRTPWEAAPESSERAGALLVAVHALDTLGEWEVREALPFVVAKFEALTTPDEMVAEAFRRYAVAIGPQAALALAGSVEREARTEGARLAGPFEYMVIAIADIGKDHREDRLFQCLRTAFRTMEHKAVGAICLGDYGDGRAVTVLKGYLDRFEGRIDRQTFYEVANAVRRLGGDLSDVRNPFASDGHMPS